MGYLRRDEEFTGRVGEMIESNCVVCLSDKNSEWASDGHLTTVKCTDCGFIWTNPRPSDVDIDKYYEGYSDSRSSIAQDITDKRQRQYLIDRDFIYKFYSDTDKIITLDFGCHDAKFLNTFDDRFDKHGVEKSTQAVNYAKGAVAFGHNIHACNILDAPYKDGYFDLIMMRGVIEHLPDPNECMEKICRLLKPGGLLYFSATPNVDSFSAKTFKSAWNQYKPPEHLLYFSDRTLELYMGRFGLGFLAKEFPYANTPYADVPHDLTAIKEAVRLLNNGVATAPVVTPYHNNMMSVIFYK